MSRSTASPTANLLRNSRLFSLPPALHKPIVEQNARLGNFRSSDSATSAYPLRQSIITPSSAAHRGDWGLKRSLPKRATKSSDPVHNVIANDCYEGVTDYASAAGHVRTLQRFQELNVGMTRQDLKNTTRNDEGVSAMEPTLDFTDASAGAARWKYKGSQVRNMTPREFEQYVQQNVVGRKEELMELLKARCHVQVLKDEINLEKEAMKKESNSSAADTKAVDHTTHNAKSAYADWLMYLLNTQGSALVKYLQGGGFVETGHNSFSTYSTIVRSRLRTSWWTHKLTNEASSEMDQLRKLLLDTPAPGDSIPKPARPVGLSDATAADWLAYFSLVENFENSFMGSFQNGTWDPSGEKLSKYLHVLRSDTTLRSPLSNILRQFLDLPPTHRSKVQSSNDLPRSLQDGTPSMTLSTHPSAGLSYLRTNAILDNHPILGPQRQSAPIRARELGKTGDGSSTIYGVAGFVASVQGADRTIDLDAIGGRKSEQIVSSAHVDSEGRIKLQLSRNADIEAKGVRDGKLEPEMVERMESASREGLMGALRSSFGMERRREREKGRGEVKPLEKSAVDQLRKLADSIGGPGLGRV